MIKRMICKNCGGNKFSFEWRYKDRREELALILGHDGFGFQLEDSFICCSKCKKWVSYDEQDFMEVKEK